MSDSILAFTFLGTGVVMFGHANEYVCLFVEILDTVGLVRQDKNKDFQLVSQPRRQNIYLVLPNNLIIVSGLTEFVALLKYIEN